MHRLPPPRRALGFSVVELCCTLSIGSLLLGSALPVVNGMRDSQRLQAAAALLETDLQHARSQAIATHQPVRVQVQQRADGGSCYVVHTGPASSCSCDTGVARCDDGSRLLRVESQLPAQGVVLQPLARSLVFDARSGTVTPTATFKFTAGDGRSLHQVVNIMGRVRSCSPGGKVGGLRRC